MKDRILMPRKLTAENGAKAKFTGEFHEEIIEDCQACDGDGYTLYDYIEEYCNYCAGTGKYTINIPIEWTTLKHIYNQLVKQYGVEVEK